MADEENCETSRKLIFTQETDEEDNRSNNENNDRNNYQSGAQRHDRDNRQSRGSRDNNFGIFGAHEHQYDKENNHTRQRSRNFANIDTYDGTTDPRLLNTGEDIDPLSSESNRKLISDYDVTHMNRIEQRSQFSSHKKRKEKIKIASMDVQIDKNKKKENRVSFLCNTHRENLKK